MQFRQWLLSESKKSFGKKLINQYGRIKVYLVDGEAIRNSSLNAEEFGESGCHSDYPKLILPNEIFIEDDVKTEEIPALIAGRLFQLKCLTKGMNPTKAYRLSLRKEEIHRQKVLASKRCDAKPDGPTPDEIHIKKYGEIPSEGITVWIVDGEEIRRYWKHDFLEAGHGYVYNWVPKNEIWVEKGIHEDEIPLMILHEFVEREIMKYKHLDYNHSHNISRKVEYAHRNKGFSKQMALNLNKNEALVMAKKYL